MPNLELIHANDNQTPAQALASRIRQRLTTGQSVVWLVSGGSAIAVAVRARQLLGAIGPDEHVSVCLIDERFGPVGHADSNWQQLLDAGFDTTGLQAYPILADSTDVGQTAARYDATLTQLLQPDAYSIGLFGIGSDGHTAGLLPHSAPLSADELVGRYQGPDYERVTITPRLIKRLNEIVVYACGDAKGHALEQMQQDGSASDIPARLLWGTQNTTVYTDWQGA
jgi:6-phosphogluconolactonase